MSNGKQALSWQTSDSILRFHRGNALFRGAAAFLLPPFAASPAKMGGPVSSDAARFFVFGRPGWRCYCFFIWRKNRNTAKRVVPAA